MLPTRLPLQAISACLLTAAAAFAQDTPPMNLILNPSFEFHAFEPHRLGRPGSSSSNSVAFWSTNAWGDITVTRESHAPADVRPAYSAHNLASIAPGKKLWQFATLPELSLAHGESVSLLVHGYQKQPGALKARVKLMKLDSEDGTWSPKDFGMGDARSFPKHSRGELVVAQSYDAQADQLGAVTLRIEDAEVLGRVTDDGSSHSDDINTIGITAEFENTGTEPVWLWSPSLCRGPKALERLPAARGMNPAYRSIPRTVQRLWKGEAVHIIAMGSSIDRGSANPPMYLFDEDPASPTFKHPLAEGSFDGSRIGQPGLDGYFGWWQHYFCYTGRLKQELMRKFGLPPSKVLMNWMACDGSCVGEAHSGLADYASLAIPPNEGLNGHKSGKTWQELYPTLFTRPEGPRPDLVIFGSGANERTDTPEEVAVFEGTIRWFQRHYPETEFLFCMWQNQGGYTSAVGDLQALALRYQIPVVDYGQVGDDVTRWCSKTALVPADGHPQAAAHYLWAQQLERAFECWDPVEAGQMQVQLPERLHPNTYGWEGDMVTYGPDSPRLKGGKFVFDDTALNCWGAADGANAIPYVDGQKHDTGPNSPGRDVRNSFFRHGSLRLGDRHILELQGNGAKLTYVDAKQCPDRRTLGVGNPAWRLDGAPVTDFASEWGAPFGSKQATLEPGQTAELDVVCTDAAVAYADAPEGGTLRVLVDGVERLLQPTSIAFVDLDKQERYMENRRGILSLGFGLHRLACQAVGGPVTLLGVFAYDARSNRRFERRLVGLAAPGDVVQFSPAFRARPMVICGGGLAAAFDDTTPSTVRFTGAAPGAYEIIGE